MAPPWTPSFTRIARLRAVWLRRAKLAYADLKSPPGPLYERAVTVLELDLDVSSWMLTVETPSSPRPGAEESGWRDRTEALRADDDGVRELVVQGLLPRVPKRPQMIEHEQHVDEGREDAEGDGDRLGEQKDRKDQARQLAA